VYRKVAAKIIASILFYTALFYHWFYVVLQINKINKSLLILGYDAAASSNADV